MSDIHSNEAIERLRQKVKATDDSLHDVLRMVETVSTQQKDINSMNMKLKESVQKISTLEVQLGKSISARTMQSKEIQMQLDKLKRSKEECQKLSDLNRVEKQKAREYEQKLRDLESSKDEIMKYMKYKDLKIQHLESDAVQHKQKIEMLENVLENQKSKLMELRTELEKSQNIKREQLNLFGRDEEKMNILSSTTQPVALRPDKELEKENKELKQNERTDRRLIENEPNIADLSDLNRPTKLAEKYAELYDNDWTDAYSYLETLDAYKGSEVTVIAALVTMLTTAYKMSLETAENQLQALRHILGDFHGKYRKEIEKAFPRLDSSVFESEALKPYLQKCLELCWLMAIQDPPIHLKCDGCKKGELFDKTMYKEYTQAGPLIIYTVWPVLFLKKDGALLCKGVVQCDKRLSSSLRIPQGKTVIRVSKKSASLRASGTQPLTPFPAKDDISDKIDRATIMETKRDHSEKRNSQTAADNTGGRVHESEILITTF